MQTHSFLLGNDDGFPGIGNGAVKIKNSQFDLHGGTLRLFCCFDTRPSYHTEIHKASHGNRYRGLLQL